MVNQWESWVVGLVVFLAAVWGVRELWKVLKRFARILGVSSPKEDIVCSSQDSGDCCGCASAGECKPQVLEKKNSSKNLRSL